LWRWIKEVYGGKEVENFRLGLDDPELEEFAPDLLLEFQRGERLANRMFCLLWCDHAWEYDQELALLRQEVDEYWSQTS
jgi:hypothetical protein